MSAGVLTPELRFKFVEKLASEVGAGKTYCMLATLDQIAELFFRVKHTSWEGSMGFTWDPGGGTITRELIAPTASIATPNVRFAGDLKRGYWIRNTGTTTHDREYLTASYTVGGVAYRDIAENENGLHVRSSTPKWNDPPNNVQTAYSYHADNFEDESTGEHVFHASEAATFFGAFVSVDFTGEIAYVTDPADPHLLSPLTQFYIGVIFDAFDYESLLPAGYSSLYSVPHTPIQTSTYTIRLQTGDITCVIYGDALGFTDYAALSYGVIQTATEWFPYAKNSPAVPVWNSATGARL